MTCACSTRVIPFFRSTAAILLIALSMAAHGGENGGASSIGSDQRDAFHQAMRNAEEELRGYGGHADNKGAWSLSMILSLVALAAAIGLAAWLTYRLRGSRWCSTAGKEMRIIERLPLGRQSALIIVEVDERRYLVADHPCGIVLLGDCLPVRNAGESPSP
ncbi:MAG: flagellar biosynthetic protein FliO [Planctomycetota bacterium]|nr:flagellar biosynthetic protein FliO [Planctomycetota bacterium]